MERLQTAETRDFSAGESANRDLAPENTAPRTASELSAIGVAGAMHDLGNLIQVASSAIALIARHPEMPPAQSSRMLAQARTCLDHAGIMARRNLGLIRDRGLPDAPVCSAAGCLGDVAALIEAMGEPGLLVEVEVEPDLPGIACDPMGLQNAVLNLVFNARDAMFGRGRVAISAQTHSKDPGGAVEIHVTDHGIGMSRATISRAFAPFFTTKSDGLGGVGLPMVDRFVRNAGGEIVIESEPGVGTTVILRLPAVSPDPRTSPSAQEPNP